MWSPVVTRSRLLKRGNVGLSRLRCNVSDRRKTWMPGILRLGLP